MDQEIMEFKLPIVTWLWHDQGLHPKKKIVFTPEHVNNLYYALCRHLDIPFELICITDDPDGIEYKVKVMKPLKGMAGLPGCFRRLELFSKEMKDLIGPRFACIDLDVVIVDNVTDIFTREEDFIIWGEHWRKSPYCGSFFIMNADCRRSVYTSFRPDRYKPNHRGRWPYGTDQDHICRTLYPLETMLTTKDGIYGFNFSARCWYRPRRKNTGRYKEGKYLKEFLARGGSEQDLIQQEFRGDGTLPENTRMVFFNGKCDPSQSEIQKDYPWVKEHWNDPAQI